MCFVCVEKDHFFLYRAKIINEVIGIREFEEQEKRERKRDVNGSNDTFRESSFRKRKR